MQSPHNLTPFSLLVLRFRACPMWVLYWLLSHVYVYFLLTFFPFISSFPVGTIFFRSSVIYLDFMPKLVFVYPSNSVAAAVACGAASLLLAMQFHLHWTWCISSEYVLSMYPMSLWILCYMLIHPRCSRVTLCCRCTLELGWLYMGDMSSVVCAGTCRERKIGIFIII